MISCARISPTLQQPHSHEERAKMDAAERESYEKQSQDLRADLKSWESKWAKEHKGKKPDREAIKQNPDIGMPLHSLHP